MGSFTYPSADDNAVVATIFSVSENSEPIRAMRRFAVRSKQLFDAIGNGNRTDSRNFLPEFSVRADFVGTDERNTV
ncbi:hypothetical protein SKAU_G00302540 [Synaphobranchus kaupii]|uniref:Uncharacterized protein n=1 Tax=Synaphobranchus kaupii TaxID=118154 RepID=A0A9Q1ING1_SYNKA|nr:hypothetical protein SKAU_G00302540 [Synaphobranchus kaupii]